MPACLVCQSDRTEALLDLGWQPVSSHYTASADTAAVEHPLSLTLCAECSVVQLACPFPFQDLVPRYDWITYREPETHLDAVVDKICRLPGLNDRAAVAGLTFKDRTTLDRMRARGFSRVWSLDSRDDLGIIDPNAKVESIQALLTPAKASEIVGRRGPVDLLIARHIVEHAEAPRQFMHALLTLLAPNGYLLIEVPDCGGNLSRRDYTMIWEEHTLYLTSETAPQILAAAGCVCLGVETYPFPYEDVIVLYAQKPEVNRAHPPGAASTTRKNELAREFSGFFEDCTKHYHRLFTDLTRDGRRLAAYGAGHLTCAFINYHDLGGYFAFVVDDTPHKQGLFLPKCGLPIVSADRLVANEISACIFGLAPQLEDKIIARNRDYVDKGGQFHSMFVDSPRSLRHIAPAITQKEQKTWAKRGE